MNIKEILNYDSGTGVFRWKIKPRYDINIGDVAGYSKIMGYTCIKIKGREYKAHRLAWLYVYDQWPDKELDHINCVKHDNRIINLRESTRQQNNWNKPKLRTNKSGFKGVSWHQKSQKYIAQCSHNNKKIYLGVYDSPEQAHDVYQGFIKELHGDFHKR